jgi:hypothetical protein
VSQIFKSKSPVVFLSSLSVQGSTHDDLLVVRQDGEIQCLDGDNLQLKWTSPSAIIGRVSSIPDVLDNTIEFALLTDAYSASRGLFKGRPDILSAFPEGVTADGYNPELLVVISRPTDSALSTNRMIHTLALPQGTSQGTTRAAKVLLSKQITWFHGEEPRVGSAKYELHVSSGLLYELIGQTITTYDLTASTPKIQTELFVEVANSFLRLSATSIMASSARSVDIFNPAFSSIQASIRFNDELATRKKRKIDQISASTNSVIYKLVSYSPKQGVAHAISGNDLVAFQIDRKEAASRHRSMGLLIDSLGCGLKAPQKKSKTSTSVPAGSFGDQIPGSIVNEESRRTAMAAMDKAAAGQDVDLFEKLIAMEFKITRADITSQNGDLSNGASDAKPIPTWNFPEKRSDYPQVDGRWARYALGKIFSWTAIAESEPKLSVVFFPDNVVRWLIETGNLNKANIESALRQDLLSTQTRSIPSGQLIQAIADVDPEMSILLAVLSNTFLDAFEIIYAIKLLMQSFELFGEQNDQPLLLTNGNIEMANEDVEEQIEMEEAAADADLQLAEFQLGDDSSIRGEALSLALGKLHACPTATIIEALQRIMVSHEIVALIYLLRLELARGSWTARYMDVNQMEQQEIIPQDGTILLVTDLLNACVDAIGAGGWLSGDAMLANGDHFESEELIASLKLEVSAALEGIEEAAYLKGLTAEMVRYGEAVQNAIPWDEKKRRVDSVAAGIESTRTLKASDAVKLRKKRPLTLAHGGKDTSVLPYGLRAEQQISLQRVGAGGEVHQRSARDIGRLKSRKVGKYSLERIVV